MKIKLFPLVQRFLWKDLKLRKILMEENSNSLFLAERMLTIKNGFTVIDEIQLDKKVNQPVIMICDTLLERIMIAH